jgi:hypothetical protein
MLELKLLAKPCFFVNTILSSIPDRHRHTIRLGVKKKERDVEVSVSQEKGDRSQNAKRLPPHPRRTLQTRPRVKRDPCDSPDGRRKGAWRRRS